MSLHWTILLAPAGAVRANQSVWYRDLACLSCLLKLNESSSVLFWAQTEEKLVWIYCSEGRETDRPVMWLGDKNWPWMKRCIFKSPQMQQQKTRFFTVFSKELFIIVGLFSLVWTEHHISFYCKLQQESELANVPIKVFIIEHPISGHGKCWTAGSVARNIQWSDLQCTLNHSSLFLSTWHINTQLQLHHICLKQKKPTHFIEL